MEKWWEKSGETSKAFENAAEAQDRPVPGGDPSFLTHTNEDLENWREALERERAKPRPHQSLTIGGRDEQAEHARQAEEREKLIRKIEAEQLHRLHLELDMDRSENKQGKEHDDGDHER